MWKRILKYLIGAITIVSLVIGTQIVTAETGLIVKLPKPITNIASELGQSFTLGMVGVAYATTPDYICDGVADDVEIQAAMNALPATGGELFFFGGNYVLTATVTRAINNISIVGSGYSTYFTNDGGTALFSNGAQTGWHFENFRTDAGYLTLATACTVNNVWDNTYFVDSTVGTGAIVPVNPRDGQEWLQVTTGRNILLQYDGSEWRPLNSYGTIDYYVDATDGTDDVNHGTAVDGDAFKTIQYAVDMIPYNFTDNVSIHINNETYAENVTLRGKNGGDGANRYINFYGTLALYDTGIATGGRAGNTNLSANITGVFGASVYGNKLLVFTSGANVGEWRIVAENDASNIMLCGETLSGGAPGVGDTFDIYSFGTEITGNFQIGYSSTAVFYDIKFNASTGLYYSCGLWGDSYGVFNRCWFRSNGVDFALDIGQASGQLNDCLVSTTSTAIGIEIENCGQLEIFSTRIIGGGTSIAGIAIERDSCATIKYGCDIVGWPIGIRLRHNSSVWFWTPDVYSFIHGNTTYGIRALSGGQGDDTSYVVYGVWLSGGASLNGTNESAVAAEFAYID